MQYLSPRSPSQDIFDDVSGFCNKTCCLLICLYLSSHFAGENYPLIYIQILINLLVHETCLFQLCTTVVLYPKQFVYINSWYFEQSQPQRITSWLKAVFSLSPMYSACKSSNHRLSINHKISPDKNLHKTKHTQTSNTKTIIFKNINA